MMTREHRQEALGQAYVRAVAAKAGLLWGTHTPDYGVDICLRSVRIEGSRRRDAGAQLDVQLKSTARASVKETGVVFDLEVPAYNDLRWEGYRCPRILIVFVMPEDEHLWLTQTTEELTLRHCAYWIS